MSITTVESIITERVLDPDTGEILTKDFREMKTSKKTIKGGFSMIYKSYDEALEQIVNSKMDLKISTTIRDMFTQQRIENVLSTIDLSKKLSVAKSKVAEVIARMVKEKLLGRISRGVYRLNPFMYLPYKSDGLTLQKEWTALTAKEEE